MRQKGIAHLFLLVVIFVIGIGTIGYLAYQNAQIKKGATPTPSPESNADYYNVDRITNLLDDLVNSQNLEFSETNTMNMRSGCIGTGESHNIIQGTNYYSLSESNFKPETIQYCPPDLKEVYSETYWIDGKIYYKQYSHKDFKIKEPNSNIAIPSQPNEYLIQLLPNSETINIITSDDPSQIAFTGTNSMNATGNYYIELSDDNTIKTIEYDIFIENDDVAFKGNITFNIPTQALTPPSIP